MRTLPLPRRLSAALVVGLVLAAACGGDDGAADPTSTTRGSTTTTTEPTTTTTQVPLTEDDLRAMMLQASDVPAGYTGPDDSPVEPYDSDPPDCGLALVPHPDEPPTIQVFRLFEANDTIVLYSHDLQYYPEGAEAADLPALRAAIAGPCAEGFEAAFGDGPAQFRFEPLPDPEMGDGALAARLHVDFVLESVPIQAVVYLVGVHRGTTFSVVQVLSGDAPSVDLVGPDLGLEETLRVAEAIDQRIAAVIG